MRRQYHLPGVVGGTDAISDNMSRQAGRQLVATVLAGVARGVRRAAPDEVTVTTGPARRATQEPSGDRTGRLGGGHYAVPSYDDGGRPMDIPLHQQVFGARITAEDPGPEAFEIDDDLRSYPGIEEILRSPQMRRYFGLRDRYRQLYPRRRLPGFARLRSDQLPVMMRAYDQLQQLSELDWTLLERQIGPDAPPGNWGQASDQIDRFVHSDRRAQAARDVAARDATIDAAHARVSPARESQTTARFTGLDDLYKTIKRFELLPDGRGSKEFRSEFERRKREAKNEMLRKLHAANFATTSDFDDAVRRLRRVVRERAVNIALATMKQSERVLQAELHRYQAPGVLAKLATELAAMRRPPAPSEDAVLKLLGDYPILRDTVALRGALAVRVPDILGDVLRHNAQAQLDNIDRTRATLRCDTEEVFGLNRIIDEALDQLGLPPESVQARLIRERRAAPGHPVRETIEKLALVLSFAFGPLAAVGYVARAVILAVQIQGSVERRREEERQRAAAHAGTPLADPPVPSGQGRELFALVTAAVGVLPGVPRTLLPPGGAGLSANAGELLAAGAASEGRPLGFLPGTRFTEAGPGQVAIWHPDFPDEVFRLDANGLTRYSRASGVVQQTGHWPRSTVDAAGAAGVPAAEGALVRSGATALRVPVDATIPPTVALPPGAARSGFGSLGAMSRLSPAAQAADARLRALIQALIERTAQAAARFRGFAGGERTTVLLGRAEALANRLRSYEQRLTVGLSGYRKGWTEPAMDEAVREAIGWVEPRLHSATIQVENLERLVQPVPFPTVAEQAVIDQYVKKLALLRDLQGRVQAGDAAALAQRTVVRDELIGLERRAARHSPGEEGLLSHVESLARHRRRLLGQGGLDATVVGLRSDLTAATILPGGLANRTFAEIAAELRTPPQIELPPSARQPGTTREPLTGATTLTWAFPDGSYIRIDVPGPGMRPFASGMQPHIARVGPYNIHYDDHGIAVPADSTPAHIPLRVTGQSDPLYAAINVARQAATGK
ncbi:MAG: hypothetical protein ABR608_10680 [Pseudonocardiaceae bacterium]|nr:hypothetical protein [Actinomycetota bacterium]